LIPHARGSATQPGLTFDAYNRLDECGPFSLAKDFADAECVDNPTFLPGPAAVARGTGVDSSSFGGKDYNGISQVWLIIFELDEQVVA
jgi:hypothetical protein